MLPVPLFSFLHSSRSLVKKPGSSSVVGMIDCGLQIAFCSTIVLPSSGNPAFGSGF